MACFKKKIKKGEITVKSNRDSAISCFNKRVIKTEHYRISGNMSWNAISGDKFKQIC